jgi:hypothetical protein
MNFMATVKDDKSPSSRQRSNFRFGSPTDRRHANGRVGFLGLGALADLIGAPLAIATNACSALLPFASRRGWWRQLATR